MNRPDLRADPLDDDRSWQAHERTAETEERTREFRREMESDRPAPESTGHAPLFDPSVTDDFRTRWTEVQGAFVDDPRSAVERANRLVGEVTDRLNETFLNSRTELERQWAAGEEASTEELRQALQRYRSFFERLLNL